MPIARMVGLGEDGIPRLREVFRRLVRCLAAAAVAGAIWSGVAGVHRWPTLLLVTGVAIGIGEPLLWRSAIAFLPQEAQRRFRQQLKDLEAAKARSRRRRRRPPLWTTAAGVTPTQIRLLTDRPAMKPSRDVFHFRPHPRDRPTYDDPAYPWFGELAWDGKFLRATGADGVAEAWRTRATGNVPPETVVAEIAAITNPSGDTVLGAYFLNEESHRLATVAPRGLNRRVIGVLARRAGVRYRVYGLPWGASVEQTAAMLFPKSVYRRPGRTA